MAEPFESQGSCVLHTIEMHTGGEPVRIVHSGYPSTEGKTIIEKRRYAIEHLDHLRRMLMNEPRGHSDMFGAILVEKDCPEADIAVLFIHNEGYATMCGHAVISLARYAVDYNLVKPVSPVTRVNIECPCGLVAAHVQYQEGKSGDVRFESVPSFTFATDLKISLQGIGEIQYDIAYGGAFYAFIDIKQLPVDFETTPASQFVELGRVVKKAIMEAVTITHPLNSDLAFLFATMFTDGKAGSGETRQLCVFADGQVDRSPCGSGVSARVALQYHKKQIQIGQQQTFVNAKVGSKFTGTPLRAEPVGCYEDAVVVEVGGRGYYTGEGKWRMEAGDKLARGFLLD